MANKRLLRFEDKVYIKQWLLFRKPKLSDMVQPNGELFIECGIGKIRLVPDISTKETTPKE